MEFLTQSDKLNSHSYFFHFLKYLKVNLNKLDFQEYNFLVIMR